MSTSGCVTVKDGDTVVDVRISDRDRAVIEDFYSHKKKRGLPPGLARRDTLPRDLEGRLAKLPDNYVRVRVGRDIVLMDRKARVVVDVVSGVAD